MHAGGTKEIYEIYQLSVTDRYKRQRRNPLSFSVEENQRKEYD